MTRVKEWTRFHWICMDVHDKCAVMVREGLNENKETRL
jgi:hypothetical protein